MVCACLTSTLAHGDEIHLYGGGTIDARVIAESSHVLHVETITGEFSIPMTAVKKRVRRPSLVERYAAERDRAPLTAARHVELALWCRAEGMASAAKTHADAALRLDRQNADARRLAGYIRLDDVWMFTGAPPGPAADERGPARRDMSPAILQRLVGAWQQRIRVIKDTQLSPAAAAQERDAGRRAILRLGTALAVPGACRVLGAGPSVDRILLAETLGAIEADAATLNLLAMTLTDPAPEPREAAAAALRHRDDPRVGVFLRRALACRTEIVVRRAATALGWMVDRSAVRDLIDALPIRSSRGRSVDAKTLFVDMAATFSRPAMVPIGDPPAPVAPFVALIGFGDAVKALAGGMPHPTGGYRSEVQDALIAITGENYGFDIAAWRDWVRRHPPDPANAPATSTAPTSPSLPTQTIAPT
ncbi:MAG: hypothetical protein ACE5E6_01965 [Phycisphaerae bacterium]